MNFNQMELSLLSISKNKKNTMFEIRLKNNKSFYCDANMTIFDGAKQQGIVLEHSCLSARCRSCIVRILEGKTIDIQEDIVLSDTEKETGHVLSCNARPQSNLILDSEDLTDIEVFKPSVFPVKINSLEKLKDDVINLELRLPPNNNFKFVAGQHINIIKGIVKRSYSIANIPNSTNEIKFYIKRYDGGVMSDYFFSKAEKNDLLRIEGPLGTFFYRNSPMVRNIIFLATGTGIAPINAILEQLNQNPELCAEKKIWLFWGGRYIEDIFMKHHYNRLELNYIPVLSRKNENWNGETGYVQDALMRRKIDLKDAQVYACGSIDMITSARELLINNNLKAQNFYSDAFVISN